MKTEPFVLDVTDAELFDTDRPSYGVKIRDLLLLPVWKVKYFCLN